MDAFSNKMKKLGRLLNALFLNHKVRKRKMSSSSTEFTDATNFNVPAPRRVHRRRRTLTGITGEGMMYTDNSVMVTSTPNEGIDVQPSLLQLTWSSDFSIEVEAADGATGTTASDTSSVVDRADPEGVLLWSPSMTADSICNAVPEADGSSIDVVEGANTFQWQQSYMLPEAYFTKAKFTPHANPTSNDSTTCASLWSGLALDGGDDDESVESILLLSAPSDEETCVNTTNNGPHSPRFELVDPGSPVAAPKRLRILRMTAAAAATKRSRLCGGAC